jgi:N-acetylmuramoyl-L-alanine amidase
MTAVRLEAGYMSSTADLARLREPHTRQQIAESVTDAIHDFFGPG